MKKRLLALTLALVSFSALLVLPAGATGEKAYCYILQGMISESEEATALGFDYAYFGGGDGAFYDLNGDGIQELIAVYWRPDDFNEGSVALYAKLFTLTSGSSIPALAVSERLCGAAGMNGFSSVVQKDGQVYFCTYGEEGDTGDLFIQECKLYALNGTSATLAGRSQARSTGDINVTTTYTLDGKTSSQREYEAWMNSVKEVLTLPNGTDLSTLLRQVNDLPDDTPTPSQPTETAPQTPIPSGTSTSGMKNFSQLYSYYGGLFWDVTSDDWFEEYVASAYKLGLMNGMGNGSFSPRSSVTLAQSITLAARLHSIYHSGSDQFIPVPNTQWYYPYLIYANANGIPCGFRDLDAPATREQFAYILSAALPAEELPANPSNPWAMDFLDYSSCAYTDAIDLLTRAGIIRGIAAEYGGYRFAPNDNIDRASVAAIVTRMADPTLR